MERFTAETEFPFEPGSLRARLLLNGRWVKVAELGPKQFALITEPIDDSEGIPVPDADLPDGLVVEPATDNVKIPDGDKPAEPAEGEPA